MTEARYFKVSDVGHSSNKVNTVAFAVAYREWLKRRGLTDPALAAEYQMLENSRNSFGAVGRRANERRFGKKTDKKKRSK